MFRPSICPLQVKFIPGSECQNTFGLSLKAILTSSLVTAKLILFNILGVQIRSKSTLIQLYTQSDTLYTNIFRVTVDFRTLKLPSKQKSSRCFDDVYSQSSPNCLNTSTHERTARHGNYTIRLYEKVMF